MGGDGHSHDADSDKSEEMRECCGCDMSCEYRQLFTCPAMIKMFQTVLGGIASFLTICTLVQKINDDGPKFSGLAQLLIFYVVATLCVIESIIFLCFYVAVDESTKNAKLKKYVKLFDVGAAIFLLIGVVIFVYIMIKWQMDYANNEANAGKQMPVLGEMITVLVLTLINVFLYFLAVFLK